MKPQIVIENLQGRHNTDLIGAADRLIKGSTYKDLSTVCVVPTRGMISAKVVQSWMGMMPAMNQRFVRIFMIGMEVGEAYTQAIQTILANPELSTWKYVLTLEEDNMPPPDGLLRLYESIEGGVDGQKYDAVGALYWTKGIEGQPMIYGVPMDIPLHFRPQVPRPDTVQPCNGLGMGFTLFRMDMFRDPAIPKPMFKTCSEFIPGQGTRIYTQDLYFFENIHRIGYKVACDTRVKVGHYSVAEDIVW